MILESTLSTLKFHLFSLAVICAGIHHISDAVFLSAAEGLADLVGEEDIAVGRFHSLEIVKCQLKSKYIDG